jgi:hypothetical protein
MPGTSGLAASRRGNPNAISRNPSLSFWENVGIGKIMLN